ncbi:glucose 1-dehydrogenase [Mesorhizobium qingshengii]|uniref:Glucose 1-dehydrogenase n=1 Tax=Mesorhizobium qingshengii TaxID=1165689 RepID=A0ABT4QY46_9HYPH|nr:glucose 1-dehydrogenase [Mesorhizobium qingshengii]MCZ8546517.1 glucose 1-dehydrogenase [Mesorhizobium qingshengii]
MSKMLEQLFSLYGKVALITGGGRGIGQETALMLSQAGAKVAVLDRDESAAKDAVDAIVSAGGEAVVLVADVSKPEQIKQAFATALDRFGRLDILVNNAALVRRIPALETSIDVWREVMDVNLNAAFFCSCAAAEPMTAAGGGAIVNIASIMGISGGGIYPIASYHASKGGLVNLTRGLAVEWASRGIRVNAVAPTWVRTEFTKALLDDPEMSKTLLDLMPLRKFADTIDVAAAVLYLASPAAKVVTGHVLAVDGGYLAR